MPRHEPSPHVDAVLEQATRSLDLVYADNPPDCVTLWRVLDQLVQQMTHARDLQLIHALDHGHTQAEFARAVGTSKQAMHQKTNGARRRVANHVRELAGGGS